MYRKEFTVQYNVIGLKMVESVKKELFKALRQYKLFGFVNCMCLD